MSTLFAVGGVGGGGLSSVETLSNATAAWAIEANPLNVPRS